MSSQRNPALAIVIALGLYLLVTSAFFPFDSLSVFDGKRILQLVLFAVLLLATVIWTPLRTGAIAQLMRLPKVSRSALALFFLIGLASALRLEHPAYALVDVSMMFVLMLLISVIAASHTLSGKVFNQWAVVLLAALGLIVATQEFMGFVAGWIMESEFSYDQALIHFAHPRFYNQLQTWSIPLLAALPLLFPGKLWIKISCVALLGLQWFLVIALAARGTTVSLLTAMVFIGFWLPVQRKFWLKYQIAGLLAGAVIYSCIVFLNGIFIPHSQSGEFYAHSVGRPMAHTSGRSTMWKLSVEDAIQHPALGAGPTMYACDSKVKLPAHPHSFPLRILGEWGFIAFFLFLALGVAIGLSFLKNIKYTKRTSQTDPPLQSILAISLIAGITHACLSGLLIMPASQVGMILIAGWALSLSGNPGLQSRNSKLGSALLIAGMLIAGTILVFATKESTELTERTSYSVNYGPMVPRFWQDGRVCEYKYELTTEMK